MRAYKCDACGRIFLLTDSSLNCKGPEDDDLDNYHIPGNLYIYHPHGSATTLDLCKDCIEKIVTTIDRISGNAEMSRSLNLFYKDRTDA